MTDLLEEFHACELHWSEPYASCIRRAADEIERLRNNDDVLKRHLSAAAQENTELRNQLVKAQERPSLEQVARVIALEDSCQYILATSGASELHHATDGNWKDFLPHARVVLANFFLSDEAGQ